MEKANTMDSQVAVPASAHSIWRRILVPVLCATIVTVFSLRFYNHQRLAKAASQQMKIKQAIPDTLRYMVRRSNSAVNQLELNVTRNLAGVKVYAKYGNYDKEVDRHSHQGPNRIVSGQKLSVPNEKLKVRRDLRDVSLFQYEMKNQVTLPKPQSLQSKLLNNVKEPTYSGIPIKHQQAKAKPKIQTPKNDVRSDSKKFNPFFGISRKERRNSDHYPDVDVNHQQVVHILKKNSENKKQKINDQKDFKNLTKTSISDSTNNTLSVNGTQKKGATSFSGVLGKFLFSYSGSWNGEKQWSAELIARKNNNTKQSENQMSTKRSDSQMSTKRSDSQMSTKRSDSPTSTVPIQSIDTEIGTTVIPYHFELSTVPDRKFVKRRLLEVLSSTFNTTRHLQTRHSTENTGHLAMFPESSTIPLDQMKGNHSSLGVAAKTRKMASEEDAGLKSGSRNETPNKLGSFSSTQQMMHLDSKMVNSQGDYLRSVWDKTLNMSQLSKQQSENNLHQPMDHQQHGNLQRESTLQKLPEQQQGPPEAKPINLQESQLQETQKPKPEKGKKEPSQIETFPQLKQTLLYQKQGLTGQKLENLQELSQQIQHPKQDLQQSKTGFQTSVSLQQIWDESIRKHDSRHLKNAHSNHKDNTSDKKLYLSDTMSLQEIWDRSILEQPSGKSINELPTLIKSSQNEPTDQHGPIMMQSDTKSSNKHQSSLQQVISNVDHANKNSADSPQVSLQSADLPPLNIRSKVMDFSFKPQPGKKYVVLSVSAIGTDYNYVFSVPLTVLSWQRIGYDAIVFLVGSEKYWVSNPVLYYILKELRRLDPIVLFLDAPKENWIFMSQVSRIFAANLFDWRGMESTPLVMSDTDIWPLTKEMYDIPEGKKVLSLNSECCGSFQHRGQMYKMVPLCNIVMSVATWRDVMSPVSHSPGPRSAHDFIEYFQSEFGDMVLKPVSKGENDGWFLDQHMVSVRIKQWAQNQVKDLVAYVPRNTGRDRIDRSYWYPYRITSKNDIHMLENLYLPGTWERALPLFRQMYNETKNKDIEQYREGFIRMLVNYKIPS